MAGKLIDQGMDRSDASECALYLARLTFRAVGELFTQAQKIQAWFNKSAWDIASSGKPVQWVTPLGLTLILSMMLTITVYLPPFFPCQRVFVFLSNEVQSTIYCITLYPFGLA